jgi:RNA polymerase sigma-70 factor (ECF subfamily)
MESDDEFQHLLDRVRAKDEEAVTELVRRYEPAVRRMVRAWLRPWEARLRKLFDSADICQSVLAWFFLKGAPERYNLSRPDDLRKLLLVMVRNRVFYQIRQHQQDQRVVSITQEMEGREPPPDEVLARREFLEAIAHSLTEEEADLAQRRLQGMTWEEIAAELGGSADGRRKQLARAAERLTRNLGAHW